MGTRFHGSILRNEMQEQVQLSSEFCGAAKGSFLFTFVPPIHVTV